MHKISWFVLAALVVGCSKSGDAGSQPAGSSAPAATGAAPAAAGGLVDVDLAPLPLKIKVAAGGNGTMDKSRGAEKSVLVDIGGGASVNVNEESRDLAALKKSYEADKALYPFKKWVKEDGNRAIEEFEVDGKTGFRGFVLVDIGGKKYTCKTTGMNGAKSAEIAEQQLAACDKLSAK
jgi:hypothetical protein